MKKHSGGKIQTLASTIRIVITVIAAILALVVLVLPKNNVNFFVGFLLSAIIFGIGYFLAWCVTCILHGFGEIVENTAETAGYLKILTARLTNETLTEAAQKTDSTPNSVTAFSVQPWLGDKH